MTCPDPANDNIGQDTIITVSDLAKVLPDDDDTLLQRLARILNRRLLEDPDC